MNNHQLNYRIKKISIITIISTIAAITLFLIIRTIYFTINSSTVDLLIAPSTAQITINGKKYKNGTYHLPPAEYQVEISMPGFESKTITFTSKQGETSYIYNYLEESEGTEWYSSHQEDVDLLDVIIPEMSYQKNLLLQEKYPIIAQLPLEINYYPNTYTYIHYTISYTINNDDDITFIIHDYTGGNRDAALAKLTSRGVNVADYEFVYTDESNQFQHGHAD